MIRAKHIAILSSIASIYSSVFAVYHGAKAVYAKTEIEAAGYETEATSDLLRSIFFLPVAGIAIEVASRNQRAPPKKLEQTE